MGQFHEFEFEWGFYALSATMTIFRARTYNCNLFSPVLQSYSVPWGRALSCVDFMDVIMGDIITLCLNGTFSCIDLMNVIKGDIYIGLPLRPS